MQARRPPALLQAKRSPPRLADLHRGPELASPTSLEPPRASSDRIQDALPGGLARARGTAKNCVEPRATARQLLCALRPDRRGLGLAAELVESLRVAGLPGMHGHGTGEDQGGPTPMPSKKLGGSADDEVAGDEDTASPRSEKAGSTASAGYPRRAGPGIRSAATTSGATVRGPCPDGLSGDDMPLPSVVLLVANAFEAMTSDRPYRKSIPEAAAFAELELHAGTQFDPRCVRALRRALGATDTQPAIAA